MKPIQEDDKLILSHLADENERYMGAVVPPVFFTSLHVFPSCDEYLKAETSDSQRYVYGRVSNPTVEILEKKLAALERGTKALAFASGMAASTAAIFAVCKSGDHIICVRNVYGPVKNLIETVLCPNLGMEATFVKGDSADEIRDAIRPNTKLIYLESPTSLVFSLCDIEAVCALAKEHGIHTVIDNTYATPLYQKPLTLGVDIVMHTASKYLGGHSDLIAGALVTKDELLGKELARLRQTFGSILGPMEGWLVLRGMRTLDVRVERHRANAQKVAEFLESHPKVVKVYYPGLSSFPQKELFQKQMSGATGLMSFECVGGSAEMRKVIDSLRLFKIGCSWGGFESLVLPVMDDASQEHQAFYGCGANLIRIHVGLEDVDALIDDLKEALSLIS